MDSTPNSLGLLRLPTQTQNPYGLSFEIFNASILISLEVCAAAPTPDLSISRRDSREAPGRGAGGTNPSARLALLCLFLAAGGAAAKHPSRVDEFVLTAPRGLYEKRWEAGGKTQVLKLLGYPPK